MGKKYLTLLGRFPKVSFTSWPTSRCTVSKESSVTKLQNISLLLCAQMFITIYCVQETQPEPVETSPYPHTLYFNIHFHIILTRLCNLKRLVSVSPAHLMVLNYLDVIQINCFKHISIMQTKWWQCEGDWGTSYTWATPLEGALWRTDCSWNNITRNRNQR